MWLIIAGIAGFFLAAVPLTKLRGPIGYLLRRTRVLALVKANQTLNLFEQPGPYLDYLQERLIEKRANAAQSLARAEIAYRMIEEKLKLLPAKENQERLEVEGRLTKLRQALGSASAETEKIDSQLAGVEIAIQELRVKWELAQAQGELTEILGEPAGTGEIELDLVRIGRKVDQAVLEAGVCTDILIPGKEAING